MKNKILPFLLVACFLSSCQNVKPSSSTPIEYHVSKQMDECKVYLNTEKYLTLKTTFFSEVEDVPYVELSQFYSDFFSTSLVNEPTFYLVNQGNVTNTFSLASMIFDVKNNTITTTDLDQFVNYLPTQNIPFDVQDTSLNKLAKVNTEKSSYTKGKQITYSLNDYQMNLISYKDKIYVPFSILETISLSPIMARVCFNGDDYYFSSSNSFIDKTTNELTEFGKRFADGSLFKKEKRSESYAKYFYNSFLFEMENYYGHFSRLNISSLDEKLQQLGLKEKLLSTDSDVANEALATAINQVFHDGGHTAFTARGMTSSYSLETNTKLQADIVKYDSRYVNTIKVYQELQKLYNREAPTVEYSASNETALIHFKAFVQHGDLSLKNIDEDNASTFSLLYHSFKEIEKKSTIKNVIFDISLNGGGSSAALGEALSFITDDSIVIPVKNEQTGAIINEAVDYDNNLDGNYTDKDSYSGKYKFYILSSEFSFSCGNAFPSICKDNGYATIIGQKSGGGDCAVLPSVSVDGGLWTMSSNYSIRRKDGTNIDDGVKVDYAIEYENFYDVNKLDSKIKNIK